jgi:hypothetical protein
MLTGSRGLLPDGGHESGRKPFGGDFREATHFNDDGCGFCSEDTDDDFVARHGEHRQECDRRAFAPLVAAHASSVLTMRSRVSSPSSSRYHSTR